MTERDGGCMGMMTVAVRNIQLNWPCGKGWKWESVNTPVQVDTTGGERGRDYLSKQLRVTAHSQKPLKYHYRKSDEHSDSYFSSS